MAITIYTYSNPYEIHKEPYWASIQNCFHLCVSQTLVNGLDQYKEFIKKNSLRWQNLLIHYMKIGKVIQFVINRMRLLLIIWSSAGFFCNSTGYRCCRYYLFTKRNRREVKRKKRSNYVWTWDGCGNQKTDETMPLCMPPKWNKEMAEISIQGI